MIRSYLLGVTSVDDAHRRAGRNWDAKSRLVMGAARLCAFDRLCTYCHWNCLAKAADFPTSPCEKKYEA
jgi:hypothetical protein